MKKALNLFVLMFMGMSINAQVVINEYSAANLTGLADNFLKTEDYIELYNTSTDAVNIGGWHLSDKENKPMKWVIPAGTMIQGNSHLLFFCSGRDSLILNQYHTNFKLTQTSGKDDVVLALPNGDIVNALPVDITLVEHSHSRTEDGVGEWKITNQASPGLSNNGSSYFNGYTSAPSMDLEAGFYNGSQSVEITNNEPNSVLRFTTDGTNPTSSSQEYNGAIEITKTMVVKAQAFSNDPAILTGKMDFNTYLIDEDYSLAVFSVAADQVKDLANGQGEIIPIGSIEYFNINKEREAVSFGSLNRHGQDSWVLDHRSIDWVSRDEMGYTKAVEAPLFSYSKRKEYQKFMFRNSGDDNYPAIDDGQHEFSCHIRDEYVQTLALEGGMKLDQRAAERVILFLNGEYWGVYGMRERPVDADYTEEYYDQDKYNTQFLSTWGQTEIQYGGNQAIEDWIQIRNFILINDMSVPENYQKVDDEINLTSMIDYMIVNLTAVASDWLNYNTGWWRGLNPDGNHKKWGYILWDLDATFDYYINYSGVPNISPDARACDLDEIADFMNDWFYNEEITSIDQVGVGDIGRHEQLFLKLLNESPEFKQLYYSRYADMMNTVFSCDNMLGTLDRMVQVIRPEMPAQVARWGGTVNEWESNVTRMRDFIGERCNLVNDGMVACYDELTGPYKVTLMTEPNGIGEIDFNTLDIEDFPWSGNYFSGMDNKIKGKVFKEFEDDYVFSHWETRNGGTILPDASSRKATMNITEADTLIAVFDLTSSINELSDNFEFGVYPNPASDHLNFKYELGESANVELILSTIMGNKVTTFEDASGQKNQGLHTETLDLSTLEVSAGLYILTIKINDAEKSFKVNIIK